MKVRFALSLLHYGEKDQWKFATHTFSSAEQAKVTWEQFFEMFQEDYVLLVERERLAHEYLSLKQMTKTVTKIASSPIWSYFYLSMHIQSKCRCHDT